MNCDDNFALCAVFYWCWRLLPTNKSPALQNKHLFPTARRGLTIKIYYNFTIMEHIMYQHIFLWHCCPLLITPYHPPHFVFTLGLDFSIHIGNEFYWLLKYTNCFHWLLYDFIYLSMKKRKKKCLYLRIWMPLLMFIDCGQRKCCGGINTNKYQQKQTQTRQLDVQKLLLLTSCTFPQTVNVQTDYYYGYANTWPLDRVTVHNLRLTPQVFILHKSWICFCPNALYFVLPLQSTRNPINIHKSQNNASLACNHRLTPPMPSLPIYSLKNTNTITTNNAIVTIIILNIGVIHKWTVVVWRAFSNTGRYVWKLAL